MSNSASSQEKKSVYSWVLYDWANSAFACTVMAAFFPVYFKSFINDGVSPTLSTSRLGAAASIGSLVVAILSPVLGTIADAGGYKKKFLFLFCYLGVVMSGALFIVQQGQWLLGSAIYALAFIGFGTSNTFYDALLPSVASRERIDFVSAAGYAWGYLGGGLLFSLNVLMYLKPEFFGLSNGTDAVRWSFLSVAIWWGIFSIPLFLFVKEPPAKSNSSLIKNITMGLKEIRSTLKNLALHKEAAVFLLAFLFYNDGVNTTIKMAVDFGLSIGFASSDLIITILMVQFIGFPSALLFAWLSRHLHPKTGIYICIGAYLFALIWATQMQHSWEFYFLGAIVGLTQGGIQSLSRSYYSRFFPWDKAGEFYGFFNLLGKFSGIIGPLLVGLTAVLLNSSRLSLLSISLLFVIGALILTKVKEPS